MVTQDTSLLHRSIRDNIRYGRPERDARPRSSPPPRQAAGARLHRRRWTTGTAARLRRACRRARRQALRRPAPAHRHRPRAC
jgi:ABC-type multidrug transport system fused ATPase/permease subunit